MTVLVGTLIWAFVAIFALAFQCPPPLVWRVHQAQCADRLALTTFIEVANIVLDSFLVILPVFIVWGLQQKTKRKLIVIATFFTRVGVIVVIIAQIIVLFQPQGVAAASNVFLSWTYALLTQVVEYTSIASACGPYLKPFLENIGSGMIANNDLARRGVSSSLGSSGRRFGKGLFGTGSRSVEDQTVHQELQRLGGNRGVNETRIVAGEGQQPRADSNGWDNSSQRSTTGFIRQVTTYQVTHEEASETRGPMV